MESRKIQIQKYAPIQCTIWPRNEKFQKREEILLAREDVKRTKSKRFTLLGFVRREKQFFNNITSDEDFAKNFNNVFYL